MTERLDQTKIIEVEKLEEWYQGVLALLAIKLKEHLPVIFRTKGSLKVVIRGSIGVDTPKIEKILPFMVIIGEWEYWLPKPDDIGRILEEMGHRVQDSELRGGTNPLRLRINNFPEETAGGVIEGSGLFWWGTWLDLFLQVARLAPDRVRMAINQIIEKGKRKNETG